MSKKKPVELNEDVDGNLHLELDVEMGREPTAKEKDELLKQLFPQELLHHFGWQGSTEDE